MGEAGRLAQAVDLPLADGAAARELLACQTGERLAEVEMLLRARELRGDLLPRAAVQHRDRVEVEVANDLVRAVATLQVQLERVAAAAPGPVLILHLDPPVLRGALARKPEQGGGQRGGQGRLAALVGLEDQVAAIGGEDEISLQ